MCVCVKWGGDGGGGGGGGGVRLTAHEVVDEGVDGAVGVAEPVGHHGEGRRHVRLLDVDAVPAQTDVSDPVKRPLSRGERPIRGAYLSMLRRWTGK